MGNFKVKSIVIAILLSCGIPGYSFAQTKEDKVLINQIDQEVTTLMERGKIPGLSLVILKDGHRIIRNYGYADLEKKIPVTAQTLFQLGSTSKAFTALAVLNLAKTGSLKLDADVADYIPWFKVNYKDKAAKVTIRQLLHHTSGISWQTLSLIPESNTANSLEQTVRKTVDLDLRNLPGKKFEYATINYDILAYVIQTVTHQPFESYLQNQVIGALQLANSSVGTPVDPKLMAKGYKIGFYKARPYTAPVYKGNNAAGYVISNTTDMAKWLEFQLGTTNSELKELANTTHERDQTVPLHGMSSYAMGWEVNLDGKGNIYHEGLNPNYTSYVNLNTAGHTALAILANSNSSFTTLIGENVTRILAGDPVTKDFEKVDKSDQTYAFVTFLLAGYVLLVVAFVGKIGIDAFKQKRKFEGLTREKSAQLFFFVLCLVPIFFALYLVPKALAGFTWESAIVWSPVSFLVMAQLVLGAIAISFFAFFISLLFPEQDKLKNQLPQILVMSILSGLANMLVIVLITSSVDNSQWKYLLFYYALTCCIYILGRRYVQVNLVTISRNVVYELRIRIIDKLFSTNYQNFEKIDRGKIYTALNDNVNTIGESTNMLVMLITSTFTALGTFIYLASIAFWATILTIVLVLCVSLLYYLVSKSTNKYFEEAWTTRNVFMNHINGLMDGFKEISMHRNKKLEYKADVTHTVNEFKEKMTTANVRFINASMVGESLLVVLLGTVVFALPKIFPGIYASTIMSFVIILLYLMKPINELLGSVPAIMQLKIAWNRVQEFLTGIPATLDIYAEPLPLEKVVNSIKLQGVSYQHKNKNEKNSFGVGPIELEVKKGEILFIIGANGSGKTTLAKLLTGLYEPDQGRILINDKPVTGSQLGEYFSTVFSPSYLFEKLYNININDKAADIAKYLKILNLDEKVEISEKGYSTIDLSGGQRKRLALLQCYLEDSPIYLFDEWAADQDPGYRSFFYRILLPDMQKLGKIVIAITHDDHYFDVANDIMKMKQGRLEKYVSENLSAVELV
ncbi:cyclic peptide transporter [Pedobacter cryoconitis]|uniref:Cyclic peptide transporter n=1 Tax=Pedobacter cryoconitis TaxID=188932 RepID=A0A7W9DKQ1_9SPHI|nr:cyclic peptide export ABC transporter [Pedobacter cryoconitis]MBB5622462.1 cyclic peptide transporter [Pedobacter cryoconitis]